MPQTRWSRTAWNWEEVHKLLLSGQEPEQGWASLLDEANQRIAALEHTLRGNIALTKNTADSVEREARWLFPNTQRKDR